MNAAAARPMLLARFTPVIKVNSNFWIKDDSKTHPVCGGTKVRKLSYLLHSAQEKGASEILTFGYESSNHALVTAYHARAIGLTTQLVLLKGVDESRTKKLESARQMGAKIFSVRNAIGLGAATVRKKSRSGDKLFIIPPGGSNALGTLAMLEAATELVEQIKNGELPCPDELFVPLGTGGTAVGLAVGLAMHGMKTEVVAVRVVPGPLNGRFALLHLARKVRRLCPQAYPQAFNLTNLRIDDSALGRGYGKVTFESVRAVDIAQRRYGLTLESTYSGKALAACLRAQDADPTKKRLFWLTYAELSSKSFK